MEEEAYAVLSESVCVKSGCDERLENDADAHTFSDAVAMTTSCAEAAAVTTLDCSQASVDSLSDGETLGFGIHTSADAVNNVSLHSGECQLTPGHMSAEEDCHQQASKSASLQEEQSTSAHSKAQETIAVECSTDTSTNVPAVASMSDSCSTTNSAAAHAECNVEEVTQHSLDTDVVSTPVRNTGHMSVTDQTKSSTILSTPEVQSLNRPVVQSSLHSTRLVKCRKTGHRRITANGANLSLGQLINAVSESCLTDGLDSPCVPNSTLSSRSGATEHRMTTPVKSEAIDSCVIKDNLSRRFDSESACSTGSPVTASAAEACESPQVADGVHRPPKARKSCHSNDSKAVTDLPIEASNPAGSSFGTVCLAELVDTQSLDKRDVRSFDWDKMIFTKMWERVRPRNGFKMFAHNNGQQPPPHATTSSDGKAESLGRGTPLIPSSAKSTDDSLQQNEEQVVYQSSSKVAGIPAESSRKHVWRCRKSNWSPGSKVNGTARCSGEKSGDTCDTMEVSQRRSPRCVKQSPSAQRSDEVRQCYWLTGLLYRKKY